MSAPVVSVIVPAYNASATLARCLGTLLAQTLEDLEVIVVDDGSTDDTADIARLFATRDSRITLVQQPHGGRAVARATGLAQVLDGYVGFVDADDEALPRMYELLLECAKSSDADLVVGQFVGVSARTGETLFHATEGDTARYGTDVATDPELLLQPGASICNKLFERSLFERADIEFPAGLDFEDLAVAYRLTGEARRVEKVAQELYVYHQGNEGSVIASCDERYLQIITALSLTNNHFRARGRFDTLYPQLLEINFTHLIAGRYADLLRFGARDVRRAYLQAAFVHLDREFPGWRNSERVRAVCGSKAKWLVSTSRSLLEIYSAYLHAGRSEGYGS